MNGADACAALRSGIHLVLRVPVAIVDERVNLVALMLPHERRVPSAIVASFVNVVAGVEHEVELFRRDPLVGGEVAGLEVAATADGESETIDSGAERRRGLGPPGLADLSANAEAIEVLAAGFEAVHLDPHAVTELRPRHGRPFRRHRSEGPIVARPPSRPRR